jgi:hypothetical protein
MNMQSYTLSSISGIETLFERILEMILAQQTMFDTVEFLPSTNHPHEDELILDNHNDGGYCRQSNSYKQNNGYFEIVSINIVLPTHPEIQADMAEQLQSRYDGCSVLAC